MKTGNQSIVCKSCGKTLETKIVSLRYVKRTVKSKHKCDECKKYAYEQRSIKMRSRKETDTQIILCKKCGMPMGKQVVTLERVQPTVKSLRVCESCKEKTSEQASIRAQSILSKYAKSKKLRLANSRRMKLNNPMCKNNPVPGRKLVKILPSKHESYKRISDRMRQNNPMKDPEVVRKMIATKKQKPSTVPKGSDNWLWKGNRSFNLSVRTRLYKPWSLKIFERDCFTCVYCGAKGGVLHAHHTIPLRLIIEKVLDQNKISNTEDLKDEDPKLYSSLIDKVVEAHRIEFGITVCKKCHSDIDSSYRRKT